MPLDVLVATRPKARAGFFKEPVILTRDSQTLYESLASGNETRSMAYHIRGRKLAAVDHTIFVSSPSLPAQIAKFLRRELGKETDRFIIEEKGMEPYLAASLVWEKSNLHIIMQSADSHSPKKNERNIILIRYALPSSDFGIAGFRKKKKIVGRSKTQKLFRALDQSE